MSSDLEVRRAVSPATGQVVDLDAKTEDLAQVLDDTREMEYKLRYFKEAVSAEVLRRMDRQAEWTMREGEYELRSISPAPKIDWAGDELALVLDELVAEGRIDQGAKEAALETEISYKPKARGLNALLKLGQDVASRLLPHRAEAERKRYVTVRRLRP